MIKTILQEKQLIENTLILEPKDLVGDSEAKFNKIKNLFKVAKSKANQSLKVVLIEDVDFICSLKNGGSQDMMWTFMSELDALQIEDKVLVLATTSSLDKTDKSLRRGGRLDLDIRLDMPTDNDRYLIMKEHLSKVSNNIDP